MNLADDLYMAGFNAALAIARATADRIATGHMPTLRREMASEALRAFADEARAAIDIGIPISAPDLALSKFGAFKNNDLTGETTSHYEMDRDGFTLLAMGFTGSDASKIGAVTADTGLRTRAVSLGYVGEACPDCANFTLVRNGTCLKCDTCGSTTGCS